MKKKDFGRDSLHCKKKCKNNKYCCHCKPGPPGPPGPPGGDPHSAFRAAVNVAQPVGNNTQIFFNEEIFDLNDEYDPVTSIFTPKQDGVYSITVSLFKALPFEKSDSMQIEIVKNGTTIVGTFVNLLNSATVNVMNFNNIALLNAGDQIEIKVSGPPGVIQPVAEFSHFEAARFPSPI